jgi:hypothetical protein
LSLSAQPQVSLEGFMILIELCINRRKFWSAATRRSFSFEARPRAMQSAQG